MDGLAIYLQIGLTMAGSILFCFYIGFQLDKWFGIRGLFVTVFILLGVAGGGVVVYRQIMELIDTKKDDPGPDSE
jgi:F0F1-type ATP synthase assembly protein I